MDRTRRRACHQHAVVAQEEAILTWAIDAQTAEPTPSATVRRAGLDVLQADAAAAAAGEDRLVLIVGPAGAGKTTMLRAAVADFHDVQHRPVFGLAPTAKAARVLERETGMVADTVAKLLHEWARPDGPDPLWRLPGATIVVDEAGMLETADLYRLTRLADRQDWRLVLVGDPRQLQAVGRGGMFNELCSTGRVIELERIHRFTKPWEAAASLKLRRGDPRALDAYQAHGRITPGTLVEHLATIANYWIEHHTQGHTTAITTTTNDHVDAINQLIQRRVEQGDLDPTWSSPIADGSEALVGDIVATRRNDRHLHTSSGDNVRNRELWTITDIGTGGDLTVTQVGGQGTVTLPADYVREHVRLGYAATEPGNQSDTQTGSITLATPSTTGRGLYVAVTRGEQENLILTETETHDIAEARDILEAIIASDRADVPAVAQRRQLAEQDRRPPHLQPRCQIPDWFDELRREATNDYRDARQVLEDSQTRGQQLVDAVEAAQQQFAAATTACKPFDAIVDAADELVKQAQDSQRAAQRDLDHAGLFGRRQARTLLADTDAQLAQAGQTLKAAEDRARPTRETRAAARTNLAAARRDFDSHNLIERWSYLSERVEAAEQRIDALDGWRDWADGKMITDGKVIDIVHSLSTEARTNDSPALANVIHRWAQAKGLDLSRPTPTIERAGIEIEL